ncbi:Gfo/Idh/MocA family protein [Streptomyces radicis]|uniref:Gfo/Idh/MocA family oxidoreductase n=1 Tax=Streptomyces radicis TaxID=1750517 RepID=A0A3A9WSQ8_9ACTN|nr:Gfo/Idh/MocA family oxidoreductase [Streptomyces radicis]RKN12594.1 gfo/Idh/MocA family oxidoreductase [Streptomyces radicis]RKN27643.1 gfo/Idh/MocA family oxidoreductase [Streptomyces radicis]
MTAPAFRTVPGDGGPLRVAVVGAGAMGRAWLAAVAASPDVELACVVDVDPSVARAAADAAGATGVPTGADLTALAAATDPDAVVDVTVPEAHLPVTLTAFELGLPVLGEKPAAATLPEALCLAAAAELSGLLFMVSQSRRYNAELTRFRDETRRLGRLGILTTEFFRAPRFGGFREAMPHPLLLDMAIHPFDTARWLLDAEPVSVYCQEFNPSWSWYAGDAATTALFEMTGGARYVYTGSWCSPGLETSWNGAWRASGERGSAVWDGDHAPAAEVEGEAEAEGAPPAPPAARVAEGIDGALAAFVHALRTGTVPRGEIHENVMSLAMVASAVLSARTDRRVLLADVLATARAEAAELAEAEVRDILLAHGRGR